MIDNKKVDALVAQQSIHRYPMAALRKGYLVSALGGLSALALAFAGHGNRGVSVIFITLFALFLAYGARTALRGASTITAGPDGLSVDGPLPRQIGWNELTNIRLGYYATRRDGEQGWMELVLRGGGKRIRLDSDIEGFADIAERCLEVARARELALSPATSRNFDMALSAEFKAGHLQIPQNMREQERKP